MDRHTPRQRSFNMSQVKSKNTKPELYVFSILDRLGITYSKHFDTHGKPDIAFPLQKVAVFINGEYWHGRRYLIEKDSYQEFWIKKIQSNIARDRKNYRCLRKEGWIIVKIWDKDIKKHPRRELNKIMKAIGFRSVTKSDL